MNLVTNIPMPQAGTTAPVTSPKETEKLAEAPKVNMEAAKDSVEISKPETKAEPPKIGRWRLFFNRLTQEQINQVNKSRKLPENAKFERGFNYHVANNWMNVTQGTTILPAGYELKRGLLGFTKVVPIGSKGLFIRKTPEEKEAKIAAKAEKAAAKAEAKEAKKAQKAK